MDEKAYFKPLHLRGHSTVSLSGRQSPPPKSPVDPRTVHQLANYSFPRSPPPEGPLPPLPEATDSNFLSTKDLQPSAASWASLVDFFRPTSPSPPEAPSASPLPPSDGEAPKKRLELPSLALTMPRALRANPSSTISKFKPRPFNISRPRPSSKHRRDSDLIDLRTGQFVSRSVPTGSRSGVGQKVRGVGDDLVDRVVKATSTKRTEGEETVKRRSGGSMDGWKPLESPTRFRSLSPVEDGSARFSFLPYLPASPPLRDRPSPNPFSDPASLPQRSTFVQPPISPPPARTLLRGHQLAFDPFSDPVPASSSEDYRQGANRSVNPFSTPFDGENE